MKNVTVLGAGALGLSWTGLFLANGLKVTIHDPRPDIRLAVLSGLEGIKWSLLSLGYKIDKFTRYLSFEEKLHKAVRDADIIQECIPEDLEAKQSLYEKLGRFAPPSALILSSSAAFPASLITKKMRGAANVLIGHSFDPPHLIPLVEVVPTAKTQRENIDKALAFYRQIGKYPVLIDKEIEGIVVNRLHLALLRESIHLVTSGVITIERLDEIVRSSLGPRWAAAGPFKTLALGGGDENGGEGGGGLSHFRKQAEECYTRVPVEDMIKQRDADQIAILRALYRAPEKHS
jgi:ketoreductase RED1